MNTKLNSGGTLPAWELPLVDGSTFKLGQVREAGWWQILMVYRGLHCPICHKYLERLESLREDFTQAKTELVVVSADPLEKAKAMVEAHALKFPVAYDLSIEQMLELGLYISKPRNDDETDRPFAEPATFALNGDGKLQLIEISNTPFNRADLAELLDTVIWVQENNYPIRGTYRPENEA